MLLQEVGQVQEMVHVVAQKMNVLVLGSHPIT